MNDRDKERELKDPRVTGILGLLNRGVSDLLFKKRNKAIQTLPSRDHIGYLGEGVEWKESKKSPNRKSPNRYFGEEEV